MTDLYSSYGLKGNINPYQWVLEEAGAKVLAFEEFGSYQGDWLAKVEFEGKSGWIHDYYGSCSGCDSFEAETGWKDRTKEEWSSFCIRFAKDYLDEIKTYDEVYQKITENIDWDFEAKDMVNFMEKNK